MVGSAHLVMLSDSIVAFSLGSSELVLERRLHVIEEVVSIPSLKAGEHFPWRSLSKIYIAVVAAGSYLVALQMHHPRDPTPIVTSRSTSSIPNSEMKEHLSRRWMLKTMLKRSSEWRGRRDYEGKYGGCGLPMAQVGHPTL